ncbi:hypothetical protein VTK73DRAFT_6606 [Phialemonium thermophilum]|uniref:Ubiquitin-like protease family profile domain-containing protein n=1 Tax=Phialemonium thermophilum TaxID=223376 RepID=A0ABR3WIR7_9PEZI
MSDPFASPASSSVHLPFDEDLRRAVEILAKSAQSDPGSATTLFLDLCGRFWQQHSAQTLFQLLPPAVAQSLSLDCCLSGKHERTRAEIVCAAANWGVAPIAVAAEFPSSSYLFWTSLRKISKQRAFEPFRLALHRSKRSGSSQGKLYMPSDVRPFLSTSDEQPLPDGSLSHAFVSAQLAPGPEVLPRPPDGDVSSPAAPAPENEVDANKDQGAERALFGATTSLSRPPVPAATTQQQALLTSPPAGQKRSIVVLDDEAAPEAPRRHPKRRKEDAIMIDCTEDENSVNGVDVPSVKTGPAKENAIEVRGVPRELEVEQGKEQPTQPHHHQPNTDDVDNEKTSPKPGTTHTTLPHKRLSGPLSATHANTSGVTTTTNRRPKGAVAQEQVELPPSLRKEELPSRMTHHQSRCETPGETRPSVPPSPVKNTHTHTHSAKPVVIGSPKAPSSGSHGTTTTTTAATHVRSSPAVAIATPPPVVVATPANGASVATPTNSSNINTTKDTPIPRPQPPDRPPPQVVVAAVAHAPGAAAATSSAGRTSSSHQSVASSEPPTSVSPSSSSATGRLRGVNHPLTSPTTAAAAAPLPSPTPASSVGRVAPSLVTPRRPPARDDDVRLSSPCRRPAHAAAAPQRDPSAAPTAGSAASAGVSSPHVDRFRGPLPVRTRPYSAEEREQLRTCLAPGRPLNDIAVNDAVGYIVATQDPSKFLTVSSLLTSGGGERRVAMPPTAIRQALAESPHVKILLPLFLSGPSPHWVLAVVDRRERLTLLYDSLPMEGSPRTVRELISRFIDHFLSPSPTNGGDSINKWSIVSEPFPVQENAVDCGVATVMAAFWAVSQGGGDRTASPGDRPYDLTLWRRVCAALLLGSSSSSSSGGGGGGGDGAEPLFADRVDSARSARAPLLGRRLPLPRLEIPPAPVLREQSPEAALLFRRETAQYAEEVRKRCDSYLQAVEQTVEQTCQEARMQAATLRQAVDAMLTSSRKLLFEARQAHASLVARQTDRQTWIEQHAAAADSSDNGDPELHALVDQRNKRLQEALRENLEQQELLKFSRERWLEVSRMLTKEIERLDMIE